MFNQGKHIWINLLLLFILSPSLHKIQAQEDESGLFLSINIGSHWANKKTAMMYSGGSNFTPYGITYVFNNQFYKPDFDLYFQYPYEIVELPDGMTYQPAIEIGGTVGYRMDRSVALYLECNFVQLKAQDVFVVEVNDPNSTNPQARLDQIPVFGEERRLTINGGVQIGLFENNGFVGYLPLFASFNSARLERNYFVLNNRQYTIIHTVPGFPNQQPGGIGFGAGSGLGVRYTLSSKFTFDLVYNATYSRITMNEDFRPFGLHNNILAKIQFELH